MDSTVSIVDVLPGLLGTYGDSGNALILCKRLELCGYKTELIKTNDPKQLPTTANLYVIGGGEDSPQTEAAEILRKSKALNLACNNGAVIFGVCAGYQILGSSFVADEKIQSGLELIDVYSTRGRTRSIGEVVVESEVFSKNYLLSGFENHGGVTVLGKGLKPLGKVLLGVGNGSESINLKKSVALQESLIKLKQVKRKFVNQFNLTGKFGGTLRKTQTIKDVVLKAGGFKNSDFKNSDFGSGKLIFSDGVVAQKIVGTYMHGPVLARNYKLADFLLSMVVGCEINSPELDKLNTTSEILRLERLKWFV
jgi:hypothetical protein